MQHRHESASAPVAQPKPQVESDAQAWAPPQPITLTFDAQWARRSSGPIHAGDTVRVNYDARRLPGSDEIKAWVAFDGKLREQAIYVNRAGGPTSCEFVVPKGNQSFEIWFEGTSRKPGGQDSFGRQTPPQVLTQWDSDFERNYRFELLP